MMILLMIYEIIVSEKMILFTLYMYLFTIYSLFVEINSYFRKLLFEIVHLIL